MGNRTTNNWLWPWFDDVLRRSALSREESALFAARFIAWHLLPERVALPEKLKPPASGTRLSGQHLAGIWNELARHAELGSLGYAFASGYGDVYRHISDSELTKINDFLKVVVSLTRRDHETLAAEAVERIWDSLGPGGLSDIPLEVADFVIRLVGPKNGETIFCPDPAGDALAVAAMRSGAMPVILGGRPPIAASIYAIIAGKEVSVIERNPYSDPSVGRTGDTKFSLGAINPPFGRMTESMRRDGWVTSRFKVRSSEAYGVELGLRCVRGRFAVVVPNGFLFTSGPDGQLREHLIQEGQLQSVVSFPPGTLSGVTIPFSVLMIDLGNPSDTITLCKVDEDKHLTGRGKVRAHDRRFIGTDDILELLRRPDEESSIRVSKADVKKQDFNLTFDRYLARPLEMLGSSSRRVIPLGDLVEVVKPQFLKSEEGPDAVEIQEAIPSDIPRYGYLTSVERVRWVDAAALASKSKQVLADDDVLVSTKGTIGTVGVARPDPNSSIPLLPSQASVILRLKNDGHIQDARYLATYLRSPAVQQALGALATGGTIANISLSDLRALPVWVPDLSDQSKFIELFDQQATMQQEIEVLSRKQESLAEAAWRSAGLAMSETRGHSKDRPTR